VKTHDRSIGGKIDGMMKQIERDRERGMELEL
jgi:hypothetical protein